MAYTKNLSSRSLRESPMNIRNQFPSHPTLQIPIVKATQLEDLLNISLIGCDQIKIGVQKKDQSKIVSFFKDDIKLNRFYNSPEKYLKTLSQYSAVMTPDFSLYPEMPFPLQLLNVFKNRWCGAYWQDYGLKVIPTICWSNKDSFSFCFSGIEAGSIVAISTVGSLKNKSEFLEGFNAMKEAIHPTSIICLGNPFDEIHNEVISINYNDIRQGK